MTKIIVDEAKGVVTAIIRNSRTKVMCHAYCRKGDAFSFKKGKELALARATARMNRANLNYYRKMMKSHLARAEFFRQMMLCAEAKQTILDDEERCVYGKLSSGGRDSFLFENMPPSSEKDVHSFGDFLLDAVLGVKKNDDPIVKSVRSKGRPRTNHRPHRSERHR